MNSQARLPATISACAQLNANRDSPSSLELCCPCASGLIVLFMGSCFVLDSPSFSPTSSFLSSFPHLKTNPVSALQCRQAPALSPFLCSHTS